jgi:hypothetical protein
MGKKVLEWAIGNKTFALIIVVLLVAVLSSVYAGITTAMKWRAEIKNLKEERTNILENVEAGRKVWDVEKGESDRKLLRVQIERNKLRARLKEIQERPEWIPPKNERDLVKRFGELGY